jgi:hypothetical protein
MKKILLSVCLILLVAVSGCKKDKGNPPELPPAGTMIIDFTNFDYQGKGMEAFAAKGTDNSAWEFAAIAAGTFKIILGTTLAIPVYSFQLAIDQTPQYVSDKTWQWVYNATIANESYQAKLVGQIGSSEVTWKMYITKQNSFTDFLWFEGTSALDGNSGQWTLYHSNATPVAVLQIDWIKSGDALSSVKYTYVKEQDSFKTSYIEYGFKSGPLNAYYTIHYYNGNKFSDVNVEWNTTTHNGRIRCTEYIDGQWYCWDANRANTNCL